MSQAPVVVFLYNRDEVGPCYTSMSERKGVEWGGGDPSEKRKNPSAAEKKKEGNNSRRERHLSGWLSQIGASALAGASVCTRDCTRGTAHRMFRHGRFVHDKQEKERVAEGM